MARQSPGGGILRLVKPEQVTTSAEIAALLRSDDEAVQNRGMALFYHRFAKTVFATALSVVGSRDDADDVTMNVIMKLPVKIHDYEERGTFAGWVWTVTRNEAHAFLRKHRPRAGPEMPSSADPEDNRVLSTILVVSLLDRLSDADRDVIIMREMLDQDYHAIARELGVHEEAVRKRHARAMERLRGLAYKE